MTQTNIRAVALVGTLVFVPCQSLAQTADRQARFADQGASETLELCEEDIVRFCSNVNPGEGRILACLQAYADQVSEECREPLGKWQRPDPVLDYQTTGSSEVP